MTSVLHAHYMGEMKTKGLTAFCTLSVGQMCGWHILHIKIKSKEVEAIEARKREIIAA